MKKDIKLKHPISFEGKKIEQISLNLDAIDGNALIDAETQFTAAGGTAGVLFTSPRYCAIVAARAAGQPIELINQFKGPDFQAAVLAVQNFLFDGDSETDQAKQSGK